MERRGEGKEKRSESKRNTKEELSSLFCSPVTRLCFDEDEKLQVFAFGERGVDSVVNRLRALFE